MSARDELEVGLRPDAPSREEGKLAETAEFLREQAERDGGRLIEGDGLSELRRGNPARGMFS